MTKAERLRLFEAVRSIAYRDDRKLDDITVVITKSGSIVQLIIDVSNKEEVSK